MSSEKNWIYSNIKDRLFNNDITFEVKFNPIPFNKNIDFHTAAKISLDKIANINDNIFVSYSGGYDSEYIVVRLHELKIPFKPIIIRYGGKGGNYLESQYAFYTCRKLNIDPIVIECSEEMLINLYIKEMVKPFKCDGLYTVPGLISFMYAKKYNGILLTGEHAIDDSPTITKASMNSYDFLSEMFGNNNWFGPLIYTPDLFYATIKSFDGSPIQEFKSKLYDLPFRPKLRPIYNPKNLRLLSVIDKQIDYNKEHYQFGSKEILLETMEKWNES